MLGLMRIWFGGKVVSGTDSTHDGMGSNPGKYTDYFTGNHFTCRIGPDAVTSPFTAFLAFTVRVTPVSTVTLHRITAG